MRLHMILPRVEPNGFKVPTACPYPGCRGKHLELHQTVVKPVKDTGYQAVSAHRYRCLRCGRTFRVYPQGVTHDQTSQRVKGLGVFLYLLGLSYGAVSLTLEALGVYMARSSVYAAVQAAAEKVPGMKRRAVFAGIRTPALGGDVTSVKCKGEWLPLGLSVDDTTGLVLTVDQLTAEDADTLKGWLEPIAQAVDAKLLVTDDADSFKTVADQLGLEHQVCKGHVKRNTETLIDNLKPMVESDQDGSLAALGLTPEQARHDLQRLAELILSRRPEEEDELAEIHQRYTGAVPPGPGEKASLAYRLRLLFLDRWNLWRRLTRYRTWRGPQGETVDGTNNGCERAIGWWVKERYRTMRGYKRPKSAVNVSRLLAWCGNYLDRGGVDLTTLIA
jgi:transposase-like protein